MKPTCNLWPFGIIAAFVIFISGTIGLIVMAASHREDLVSEQYYEQEIQYQQRIDSLDRANQLGARASATYDAAGKRILISLPIEHAGREVSGRIDLYRPSAAGLDRQFLLQPDRQGTQLIDAAALPRGLWKVRVSWKVGNQEYYLEQELLIGRANSSGSLSK